MSKTEPDALTVRCPRCKAEPGDKCTTPGGNPTYQSHMARLDAAIKAINDQRIAEAQEQDRQALRAIKLPPKLKYKVRDRTSVWCDNHGAVHEAVKDYFDEGSKDCYPLNWRRVYIESDDKSETF